MTYLILLRDQRIGMARYRTKRHRVSTPAREVIKKRIRHTDIEKYRKKYAKRQGNICPICERSLERLDGVLDHCHKTGYLRGTLCRNCNGLEGKLNGIIARIDIGRIGFDRIIANLAAWRDPSNLKTKRIHPHAETDTEQRVRQKKRAAELRRKRKPK